MVRDGASPLLTMRINPPSCAAPSIDAPSACCGVAPGSAAGASGMRLSCFPMGSGSHGNLQRFQGFSELQPMLGVLVPGGTFAVIGSNAPETMRDPTC